MAARSERLRGMLLSPERRALRIACSGIVEAEHGSVASAGFEVLRELLVRGHQIDFFSKDTYVYPAGLIERHGLGYVNCDQPGLDALIARLGPGRVGWVGVKLGNRAYTRRIVRTMRRHHARDPYDLELFLGKWAYGRVAGLPVVSWIQGAPGTDSRSIRRHRRDILALCGATEYSLLRAYALYRNSPLGRPAFRHTDVCICGSRASARTLADSFAVPADSLRTLPYPTDLALFSPSGPLTSPAPRPELLWVGRVVPRKRLDLFLDAGAVLIANGWDIQLRVVGGFPFADGYRQLLERFQYPDRLTHTPYLAREDVRTCLQATAVLVQPSEEENFGSSVAEALACGTPVVVGPTNGTADYIAAGGLVFSDYTPAALAATITRVLHDVAHDPERVAAKARQAAVAYLDVERVVDGLESILASVAPDSDPARFDLSDHIGAPGGT